ncbi:MAG: GspE/PulE family protein [Phycisphaerales bacterium]
MLDASEYIVAAMIEDGALDRAAVEKARRQAAQDHVGVCDALVSLGATTPKAIAIARAALMECGYVDLSHYEIDIRNSRLMPRGLAEKHEAFPIFDVDGIITVGMSDPLDLAAVDQIRALLRAEVEPVLCEPAALRALIARAYSLTSEIESGIAKESDAQEDLLTGEEPIVAAVNQIVGQAISEGASDIHINPDENELYLRFRIDGSLIAKHGPPRSAHAGVVQRLKVLAALDLTQTRRPQDGKFRFVHDGRPVDLRVSIMPTIHGENVVLRVLSSGVAIQGFMELGLSPEHCDRLSQIMSAPHGMFLVTGPTGSGKTTTLYTALKRVNTPDRNVMTIEDPVEIRMPLVRQVQVNAEIGMTFAAALRAILRQDPDVVLLGEIRDVETARIALQAALTGHLVLSTLHTNDAPGAITRLRDLECPSFAINAALLGVLAQRLVKKVCACCARTYTPTLQELARVGLQAGGAALTRGAGCPACLGTGYKGRVVVAELLSMTPAMQRLIDEQAGLADLRRAALRDGMKPMWKDGVDKAFLGMTTLDEVIRAVAVDLDSLPSAHAGEVTELRRSA